MLLSCTVHDTPGAEEGSLGHKGTVERVGEEREGEKESREWEEGVSDGGA